MARDFLQDMRDAGDDLEAIVDRIHRKTALRIDQAVVVGTPVDTGRARSNWLVGIGQASEGTIETHGPDAIARAIEQGQAAVSGMSGGEEIHITNNLPYIERLNEGWSAQAPALYVETAVDAAVNASDGEV